jgi:hypothetical protein
MQERPPRPRLITIGLWLSVLAGLAAVPAVAYQEFDPVRSAAVLLPALMLLVIAALIAARSRAARPLMLQFWIVAFVCDLLRERFDSEPGLTINAWLPLALGLACLYLYNNPEVRAWFDSLGPRNAPAPPARRPIGIPIAMALSVGAIGLVVYAIGMKLVPSGGEMMLIVAAVAAAGVAWLFAVNSTAARIAAVLWWPVAVHSMVMSGYAWSVNELLIGGIGGALTAWYFFGTSGAGAYYESLRARPLTT